MRLIKSFTTEDRARRFSAFLKSRNIENTLDFEVNTENNKFSYPLWVHDEDLIPEAQKYLEEFEKNPDDEKFKIAEKVITPKEEEETSEQEEETSVQRKFPFKITFFFLFLCSFIFLLNWSQEKKILQGAKRTEVYLTPISELLFFDTPYDLVKLEEIVEKYDINLRTGTYNPPVQAREELEKVEKMPVWHGFYSMFLEKKEGLTEPSVKPLLFQKIREGQVWRLFSPCVLHVSFLHLLFNMMWLFVLGQQIELRLSKFKYILLILIVGIISNIAQYLMSGPCFLGYSGVVMGMVGFIWSRQKVAPWEGYPLQKAVYIFLGIYLLLMLGISVFSFITKAVGVSWFSSSIANTAHMTGLIVGIVLGRLPLFAWSPNRER